MAEFIRGTGQAVTPLQHSLDIYKQYMLNMFFKNMMGKKGSGKPITVDDELFRGRNAGDVGRYHFIPQFRGKGIRGQNASVLGNENTLDEFYMDLRIDIITQAFRKKGKMTTKRMIWDFREEAKVQLAEWFRMQTELDVIDSLSGYNTDGATYIGEDSTDYPTRDAVSGSGRCIRPDYASNKFTTVPVAAADSDTTSLLSAFAATDTMNTQLLDHLQDFAKTGNSKYAMKPIRAKNGEEYYMLVLHPKAAIDLRNDERWEKRALAALTGRGSLEGDPIATGAIGVWEHIIIKEAQFIKTHTNGTVSFARNLLLGAEAAVMAYGQTLDYSEELLDHKRVISDAADEIRGIKKLTFDGVDLNIAQVPSAITL